MDYNSKEFKRSRIAYMIQCAMEYFVALLVADSFLAKLLTAVGISDALIGIISSFISLAFVIQLFSILLVRKMKNTKRTVMIFDTLSIFFFMLLYLVPFVPLGKTAKTVLIMLCILFAYTGLYLIQSICYKWCNSFVKPSVRADYSAKKEIMSLFGGMIFTAIMGYVIDRFEGIGNLSGGFLLISITILVLNICNFICFCNVKNASVVSEEAEEKTKTFGDIFKNTFGNRSFRKVVLLSALWGIAGYFTNSFMGAYKTNDLALTLLMAQIVNIIGNFARMLVSLPFGKYSDKNSFAKGYDLALILAACAFAVNAFTTPNRWYIVIAYSILYNCSQAGISQNSYNMIYNYVDADYFVEALAIKSSIAGLCGFLASIVAGKLLDYVQNNGNMLFGIDVYGQQVMSLISLVITVAAILFCKFKIENEKIMVQ